MRRLAPTLCCFALLALAAPASAEVRTETFRHGPIEVGGDEVEQRTRARWGSSCSTRPTPA